MAEAAEMEKEIHRMRLRFESLQRTQEKLVKEMELAIDKRESISLRFHSKRVMESESDSAAPLTQIGLKKQMGTLKKALSAATVDTQGYEEAIEVRGGHHSPPSWHKRLSHARSHSIGFASAQGVPTYAAGWGGKG
jgi:predicted P-loop ATPase/GTPase